ncbi:MAG: hypothetical protein BJ554DRAFT_6581 [Olpidium bornovanus]|uniref:Uncharacterized protein n=1 Tax=Olpidium bornovanus TaxID=278681 RepID=A0A8H7ZXN8_9FUNG|nr:MAG: hypothetical protein BJ554DRAFT_6581 [Olpidium bornovanus]
MSDSGVASRGKGRWGRKWRGGGKNSFLSFLGGPWVTTSSHFDTQTRHLFLAENNWHPTARRRTTRKAVLFCFILFCFVSAPKVLDAPSAAPSGMTSARALLAPTPDHVPRQLFSKTKQAARAATACDPPPRCWFPRLTMLAPPPRHSVPRSCHISHTGAAHVPRISGRTTVDLKRPPNESFISPSTDWRLTYAIAARDERRSALPRAEGYQGQDEWCDFRYSERPSYVQCRRRRSRTRGDGDEASFLLWFWSVYVWDGEAQLRTRRRRSQGQMLADATVNPECIGEGENREFPRWPGDRGPSLDGGLDQPAFGGRKRHVHLHDLDYREGFTSLDVIPGTDELADQFSQLVPNSCVGSLLASNMSRLAVDRPSSWRADLVGMRDVAGSRSRERGARQSGRLRTAPSAFRQL